MTQVHVGLQVRTGGPDFVLEVVAFEDSLYSCRSILIPLTYLQTYFLLEGMAAYANQCNGRIALTPYVMAVWA